MDSSNLMPQRGAEVEGAPGPCSIPPTLRDRDDIWAFFAQSNRRAAELSSFGDHSPDEEETKKGTSPKSLAGDPNLFLHSTFDLPNVTVVWHIASATPPPPTSSSSAAAAAHADKLRVCLRECMEEARLSGLWQPSSLLSSGSPSATNENGDAAENPRFTASIPSERLYVETAFVPHTPNLFQSEVGSSPSMNASCGSMPPQYSAAAAAAAAGGIGISVGGAGLSSPFSIGPLSSSSVFSAGVGLPFLSSPTAPGSMPGYGSASQSVSAGPVGAAAPGPASHASLGSFPRPQASPSQSQSYRHPSLSGVAVTPPPSTPHHVSLQSQSQAHHTRYASFGSTGGVGVDVLSSSNTAVGEEPQGGAGRNQRGSGSAEPTLAPPALPLSALYLPGTEVGLEMTMAGEPFQVDQKLPLPPPPPPSSRGPSSATPAHRHAVDGKMVGQPLVPNGAGVTSSIRKPLLHVLILYVDDHFHQEPVGARRKGNDEGGYRSSGAGSTRSGGSSAAEASGGGGGGTTSSYFSRFFSGKGSSRHSKHYPQSAAATTTTATTTSSSAVGGASQRHLASLPEEADSYFGELVLAFEEMLETDYAGGPRDAFTTTTTTTTTQVTANNSKSVEEREERGYEEEVYGTLYLLYQPSLVAIQRETIAAMASSEEESQSFTPNIYGMDKKQQSGRSSHNNDGKSKRMVSGTKGKSSTSVIVSPAVAVKQVESFMQVLRRLLPHFQGHRFCTYNPETVHLCVMDNLKRAVHQRVSAVKQAWQTYAQKKYTLRRTGGTLESVDPLKTTRRNTTTTTTTSNTNHVNSHNAVGGNTTTTKQEEDSERDRMVFHGVSPDQVTSRGRRYYSPLEHWSLLHYWRLGYDLVQVYLTFGRVREAVALLRQLFREYHMHSEDYELVSYDGLTGLEEETMARKRNVPHASEVVQGKSDETGAKRSMTIPGCHASPAAALLMQLAHSPGLVDPRLYLHAPSAPCHLDGTGRVHVSGYPASLCPGAEVLLGVLWASSSELVCTALLHSISPTISSAENHKRLDDTNEPHKNKNDKNDDHVDEDEQDARVGELVDLEDVLALRQHLRKRLEELFALFHETFTDDMNRLASAPTTAGKRSVPSPSECLLLQHLFLLQLYCSGVRVLWPHLGLTTTNSSTAPFRSMVSQSSCTPAETAPSVAMTKARKDHIEKPKDDAQGGRIGTVVSSPPLLFFPRGMAACGRGMENPEEEEEERDKETCRHPIAIPYGLVPVLPAWVRLTQKFAPSPVGASSSSSSSSSPTAVLERHLHLLVAQAKVWGLAAPEESAVPLCMPPLSRHCRWPYRPPSHNQRGWRWKALTPCLTAYPPSGGPVSSNTLPQKVSSLSPLLYTPHSHHVVTACETLGEILLQARQALVVVRKVLSIRCKKTDDLLLAWDTTDTRDDVGVEGGRPKQASGSPLPTEFDDSRCMPPGVRAEALRQRRFAWWGELATRETAMRLWAGLTIMAAEAFEVAGQPRQSYTLYHRMATLMMTEDDDTHERYESPLKHAKSRSCNDRNSSDSAEDHKDSVIARGPSSKWWGSWREWCRPTRIAVWIAARRLMSRPGMFSSPNGMFSSASAMPGCAAAPEAGWGQIEHHANAIFVDSVERLMWLAWRLWGSGEAGGQGRKWGPSLPARDSPLHSHSAAALLGVIQRLLLDPPEPTVTRALPPPPVHPILFVFSEPDADDAGGYSPTVTSERSSAVPLAGAPAEYPVVRSKYVDPTDHTVRTLPVPVASSPDTSTFPSPPPMGEELTVIISGTSSTVDNSTATPFPSPTVTVEPSSHPPQEHSRPHIIDQERQQQQQQEEQHAPYSMNNTFSDELPLSMEEECIPAVRHCAPLFARYRAALLHLIRLGATSSPCGNATTSSMGADDGNGACEQGPLSIWQAEDAPGEVVFRCLSRSPEENMLILLWMDVAWRSFVDTAAMAWNKEKKDTNSTQQERNSLFTEKRCRTTMATSLFPASLPFSSQRLLSRSFLTALRDQHDRLYKANAGFVPHSMMESVVTGIAGYVDIGIGKQTRNTGKNNNAEEQEQEQEEEEELEKRDARRASAAPLETFLTDLRVYAYTEKAAPSNGIVVPLPPCAEETFRCTLDSPMRVRLEGRTLVNLLPILTWEEAHTGSLTLHSPSCWRLSITLELVSLNLPLPRGGSSRGYRRQSDVKRTDTRMEMSTEELVEVVPPGSKDLSPGDTTATSSVLLSRSPMGSGHTSGSHTSDTSNSNNSRSSSSSSSASSASSNEWINQQQKEEEEEEEEEGGLSQDDPHHIIVLHHSQDLHATILPQTKLGGDSRIRHSSTSLSGETRTPLCTEFRYNPEERQLVADFACTPCHPGLYALRYVRVSLERISKPPSLAQTSDSDALYKDDAPRHPDDPNKAVSSGHHTDSVLSETAFYAFPPLPAPPPPARRQRRNGSLLYHHHHHHQLPVSKSRMRQDATARKWDPWQHWNPAFPPPTLSSPSSPWNINDAIPSSGLLTPTSTSRRGSGFFSKMARYTSAADPNAFTPWWSSTSATISPHWLFGVPTPASAVQVMVPKQCLASLPLSLCGLSFSDRAPDILLRDEGSRPVPDCPTMTDLAAYSSVPYFTMDLTLFHRPSSPLTRDAEGNGSSSNSGWPYIRAHAERRNTNDTVTQVEEQEQGAEAAAEDKNRTTRELTDTSVTYCFHVQWVREGWEGFGTRRPRKRCHGAASVKGKKHLDKTGNATRRGKRGRESRIKKKQPLSRDTRIVEEVEEVDEEALLLFNSSFAPGIGIAPGVNSRHGLPPTPLSAYRKWGQSSGVWPHSSAAAALDTTRKRIMKKLPPTPSPLAPSSITSGGRTVGDATAGEGSQHHTATLSGTYPLYRGVLSGSILQDEGETEKQLLIRRRSSTLLEAAALAAAVDTARSTQEKGREEEGDQVNGVMGEQHEVKSEVERTEVLGVLSFMARRRQFVLSLNSPLPIPLHPAPQVLSSGDSRRASSTADESRRQSLAPDTVLPSSDMPPAPTGRRGDKGGPHHNAPHTRSTSRGGLEKHRPAPLASSATAGHHSPYFPHGHTTQGDGNAGAAATAATPSQRLSALSPSQGRAAVVEYPTPHSHNAHYNASFSFSFSFSSPMGNEIQRYRLASMQSPVQLLGLPSNFFVNDAPPPPPTPGVEAHPLIGRSGPTQEPSGQSASGRYDPAPSTQQQQQQQQSSHNAEYSTSSFPAVIAELPPSQVASPTAASATSFLFPSRVPSWPSQFQGSTHFYGGGGGGMAMAAVSVNTPGMMLLNVATPRNYSPHTSFSPPGSRFVGETPSPNVSHAKNAPPHNTTFVSFSRSVSHLGVPSRRAASPLNTSLPTFEAFSGASQVDLSPLLFRNAVAAGAHHSGTERNSPRQVFTASPYATSSLYHFTTTPLMRRSEPRLEEGRATNGEKKEWMRDVDGESEATAAPLPLRHHAGATRGGTTTPLHDSSAISPLHPLSHAASSLPLDASLSAFHSLTAEGNRLIPAASAAAAMHHHGADDSTNSELRAALSLGAADESITSGTPPIPLYPQGKAPAAATMTTATRTRPTPTAMALQTSADGISSSSTPMGAEQEKQQEEQQEEQHASHPQSKKLPEARATMVLLSYAATMALMIPALTPAVMRSVKHHGEPILLRGPAPATTRTVRATATEPERWGRRPSTRLASFPYSLNVGLPCARPPQGRQDEDTEAAAEAGTEDRWASSTRTQTSTSLPEANSVTAIAPALSAPAVTTTLTPSSLTSLTSLPLHPSLLSSQGFSLGAGISAVDADADPLARATLSSPTVSPRDEHFISHAERRPSVTFIEPVSSTTVMDGKPPAESSGHAEMSVCHPLTHPGSGAGGGPAKAGNNHAEREGGRGEEEKHRDKEKQNIRGSLPDEEDNMNEMDAPIAFVYRRLPWNSDAMAEPADWEAAKKSMTESRVICGLSEGLKAPRPEGGAEGRLSHIGSNVIQAVVPLQYLLIAHPPSHACGAVDCTHPVSTELEPPLLPSFTIVPFRRSTLPRPAFVRPTGTSDESADPFMEVHGNNEDTKGRETKKKRIQYVLEPAEVVEHPHHTEALYVLKRVTTVHAGPLADKPNRAGESADGPAPMFTEEMPKGNKKKNKNKNKGTSSKKKRSEGREGRAGDAVASPSVSSRRLMQRLRIKVPLDPFFLRGGTAHCDCAWRARANGDSTFLHKLSSPSSSSSSSSLSSSSSSLDDPPDIKEEGGGGGVVADSVTEKQWIQRGAFSALPLRIPYAVRSRRAGVPFFVPHDHHHHHHRRSGGNLRSVQAHKSVTATAASMMNSRIVFTRPYVMGAAASPRRVPAPPGKAAALEVGSAAFDTSLDTGNYGWTARSDFSSASSHPVIATTASVALSVSQPPAIEIVTLTVHPVRERCDGSSGGMGVGSEGTQRRMCQKSRKKFCVVIELRNPAPVLVSQRNHNHNNKNKKQPQQQQQEEEEEEERLPPGVLDGQNAILWLRGLIPHIYDEDVATASGPTAHQTSGGNINVPPVDPRLYPYWRPSSRYAVTNVTTALPDMLKRPWYPQEVRQIVFEIARCDANRNSSSLSSGQGKSSLRREEEEEEEEEEDNEMMFLHCDTLFQACAARGDAREGNGRIHEEEEEEEDGKATAGVPPSASPTIPTVLPDPFFVGSAIQRHHHAHIRLQCFYTYWRRSAAAPTEDLPTDGKGIERTSLVSDEEVLIPHNPVFSDEPTAKATGSDYPTTDLPHTSSSSSSSNDGGAPHEKGGQQTVGSIRATTRHTETTPLPPSPQIVTYNEAVLERLSRECFCFVSAPYKFLSRSPPALFSIEFAVPHQGQSAISSLPSVAASLVHPRISPPSNTKKTEDGVAPASGHSVASTLPRFVAPPIGSAMELVADVPVRLEVRLSTRHRQLLRLWWKRLSLLERGGERYGDAYSGRKPSARERRKLPFLIRLFPDSTSTSSTSAHHHHHHHAAGDPEQRSHHAKEERRTLLTRPHSRTSSTSGFGGPSSFAATPHGTPAAAPLPPLHSSFSITSTATSQATAVLPTALMAHRGSGTGWDLEKREEEEEEEWVACWEVVGLQQYRRWICVDGGGEESLDMVSSGSDDDKHSNSDVKEKTQEVGKRNTMRRKGEKKTQATEERKDIHHDDDDDDEAGEDVVVAFTVIPTIKRVWRRRVAHPDDDDDDDGGDQEEEGIGRAKHTKRRTGCRANMDSVSSRLSRRNPATPSVKTIATTTNAAPPRSTGSGAAPQRKPMPILNLSNDSSVPYDLPPESDVRQDQTTRARARARANHRIPPHSTPPAQLAAPQAATLTPPSSASSRVTRTPSSAPLLRLPFPRLQVLLLGDDGATTTAAAAAGSPPGATTTTSAGWGEEGMRDALHHPSCSTPTPVSVSAAATTTGVKGEEQHQWLEVHTEVLNYPEYVFVRAAL